MFFERAVQKAGIYFEKCPRRILILMKPYGIMLLKQDSEMDIFFEFFQIFQNNHPLEPDMLMLY